MLKTFAQIYQGLVLNEKTKVTSQMKHFLDENLQSYLTEYVQLLKNEFASVSNEYLEQIKLIVSKKFNEATISKNFVTDHGLIIDLLIDFNSDLSKKQFESVVNNSNCFDQVGFVFLTKSDFCREPNILKGKTQFKMNILENNLFPIIYVDVESFKLLSSFEKKCFVVNKLKQIN